MIEQFPAPELKAPAQDSPVLAATVTMPVGVPFPDAWKFTATACPGADGLGVFEVILTVDEVLAA